MTRPILVGYDPRRRDRAPVELGVAAGRLLGAPVVVLSIEAGSAAGQVDEDLLADCSQAVEEIGTELGASDGGVLAHDLWERGQPVEAREQIVLFNIVTALTLVIGVLALSAALFALNLAGSGSLIPPRVLERQLGHGVDVGQYLRLAWLVSSLATIGGALGSFVESDFAVREATYRYQPQEEDEELD